MPMISWPSLLVMFSCVFFVTFPYGVLGHVWYLIGSIPDAFFLTLYLCFFKCLCFNVSSICNMSDLIAFLFIQTKNEMLISIYPVCF